MIMEGGEHLRDYGVEAVFRDVDVIEPAEAAEEVAAAGDDDREEGRDDGALFDVALVLDGVELADHLRQAPRPERGQYDDEEQEKRLRAEEGGVLPAPVGAGRERGYRRHEPAVVAEHRAYDGRDADQHYYALYEVVERGRHVAADDDVYAREDGHDYDADSVIDAGESRVEEPREAVIEGGGIGDEENEGYGGGRDLQPPRVKSRSEEVGHRARSEVLGHDPRAPAEDYPGEQRADEGVSEAYPRRGDAEGPAELTRVADEDDGGEVGRAEGEGAQPGSHVPRAEDEAGHVGRVLSRAYAYDHHDREEDDDQDARDDGCSVHVSLPFPLEKLE